MKFWMKTYLLTLILFLICLNAGIFAIGLYSYNKNISAYEETCKSEQFYIARSFERDLIQVKETNAYNDISLLMQSYTAYYSKKDICLAFADESGIKVSSLPDNYKKIFIESIVKNIFHEKIDGIRYVCITEFIGETEYSLIYAKDISKLDSEWRDMIFKFAIIAIGISCFLAVSLFLVLKRLSLPLEELRGTTERIIGGNYSITADESGNDEFSQLAKSFNKMIFEINLQINKLELNAQQKQQLVNNLAHELRTPLTSIHGYAEYLQKAAISEEERIDSAEYIMDESERLQKISESLLDIAFLQNNEIKKEKVALKQILDEVDAGLKVKAAENFVTVDIQTEDLCINGDKVLIYILFSNLMDNAIKACNEGGKVIVSVLKMEDIIRICVCDNGKGMLEEELLHITEPFYRTDKSRNRKEGGAGLGLALCKQIVLSHNAEIYFSTKLGEGTIVTVDFTFTSSL